VPGVSRGGGVSAGLKPWDEKGQAGWDRGRSNAAREISASGVETAESVVPKRTAPEKRGRALRCLQPAESNGTGETLAPGPAAASWPKGDEAIPGSGPQASVPRR